MKPLSAGAGSSCLIWLLVFGVLSMCACPVSTFIGGFTSTLQAEAVAGFLEPYLCPEGSTAEIVTYQTTSRGSTGRDRPATGFEMQCVDPSGAVVRPSSPDYAYYWVGLLAAGSLLAAGLLAMVLAAPAGALIARQVQRSQRARGL